MNDNEIIKALECCSKPYCNDNKCPLHKNTVNTKDCITQLSTNALDLINRQKAEIERLEAENNHFADIGKMYSEIRAKAVKEFATMLKEDIGWHRTEMYMNGLKGTPRTHEITYECVEEYIDNLVKEFTEGKNDE